MDELITKAEAIEYLMTNMGWCDEDGYAVDDADEKRAIITDLVNGIPAVDAAPVVRCRDCKYWGTPFDKNDTGFMVAHCEHFDESHAFSEQFYCASGERSDSE